MSGTDEAGSLRCIVRIIGGADGTPTPHDGRYVLAWNPDSPAGILALDSTDDRDRARVFTLREAELARCSVSTVQPVRPWDCRANRPLLAITVEYERV